MIYGVCWQDSCLGHIPLTLRLASAEEATTKAQGMFARRPAAFSTLKAVSLADDDTLTTLWEMPA